MNQMTRVGTLVGIVSTVGLMAFAPTAHASEPSMLAAGATLAAGASLYSPSGAYRLTMQGGDGNLVEYQTSNDAVLFETYTTAEGGNRAVMQGDGNFVVYGPSNQVRWNTHTQDHSGSYLALQNDGNLVVYDGTAPTWANSWQHSVPGAEAYAKNLFVDHGWSVSGQYPYLNDVWGNIESGWKWNICNGGATYPSCNYSGAAYGIPQADPGDKMASYNPDWATDGETQVAWGLNYISSAYGDPENAYNHEEGSCGRPPCGYATR